MANQWANQAKTGLELRLDPCHLPQSVAFISQKTGHTMTCSLNERGAALKIGDVQTSTLSRLVLAHHFKGVAAQTVETPSGKKAVSLTLFHEDEDLCIPLLVSRNLDDVLLDWRLWADTYDLPMLMMNDDRSVIPVKQNAPFQNFFDKEPLKKENHHFLLRCRGGSLGLRLVIANQVMLG